MTAKFSRRMEFIDFYNQKLETVLNDDSLFNDVNTILDEEKSILIIDGNLPETEAERLITNPENLRKAVLSV